MTESVIFALHLKNKSYYHLHKVRVIYPYLQVIVS